MKAPLSAIPAGDEWGSIPVSLHVEESGTLRALRGKLRMLSRLNVKVFLPSDCSESFTSLRILSSLGIACGVSFNGTVARLGGSQRTDALRHLWQSEHGPIEPFPLSRLMLSGFQNYRLLIGVFQQPPPLSSL
ncbi:MAG: hypothetical protein AB2L14_08940 [Candidatus Xenobiia bacterium LiM19]